MKNLSITVFSVLLVISCFQDPKSKNYSEQNLKDDLMLFDDSDRELIQTYVVRQTMINGMVGMFGVSDSDVVLLNTLTYGEMINSQYLFVQEQERQDSLKKVEEEKERLEEEKRRVIFEQKQDSLKELVEITVVDVYERKEYGSFGSMVPHIKINMKSVKKKKVNSLKFKVNVFDKKGNELGSININNKDSFSNYDVGSWTISSYYDLYSVLKGSSVNDYSYTYEIRSMIYDGELIKLE